MIFSFCSVNLKGMLGLLSGVLRCFCFLWQVSYLVSVLSILRRNLVQKLTTMRVSLCFLADTERVRVWGAESGREEEALLAERTAVRRRGVSLLAMAAGFWVCQQMGVQAEWENGVGGGRRSSGLGRGARRVVVVVLGFPLRVVNW